MPTRCASQALGLDITKPPAYLSFIVAEHQASGETRGRRLPSGSVLQANVRALIGHSMAGSGQQRP